MRIGTRLASMVGLVVEPNTLGLVFTVLVDIRSVDVIELCLVLARSRGI